MVEAHFGLLLDGAAFLGVEGGVVASNLLASVELGSAGLASNMVVAGSVEGRSRTVRLVLINDEGFAPRSVQLVFLLFLLLDSLFTDWVGVLSSYLRFQAVTLDL